MTTTDAATIDRVNARHAAATILSLADGELAGKSPEHVRHFWAVIQARTIEEIGIPRRDAQEVEPLGDRAAEAFRESRLTYGKHAGLTIAEIEREDPDYLANLADGSFFTKRLKQYLARNKYSDEVERWAK